MEEIWEIIEEVENYQVSNLGNIKSLHYGKERIMKLCSHRQGYKEIGLNLNGKRIIRKVHRLVAIAFIQNPENKETVNHINGIKHDNRVENLEWCTQKENVNHAWENNLVKLTKYQLSKKLTEKEVLEIRASNLKPKQLSLKYDVSITNIGMILKNKIWNKI